MFERIVKSKDVDLTSNSMHNDPYPPLNNSPIPRKSNYSTDSDHETPSIPLPKTSNIVNKILFPYDDSESRRNAHKYLENYTSIKPDINKNLLTFLHHNPTFFTPLKPSHDKPISHLSIRDKSPIKPLTKTQSFLIKPAKPKVFTSNPQHFNILNRFMNANERKIEAFYGKNDINIPSISRVVERNITKAYLPINVNKVWRTMVPAGHSTMETIDEVKRSKSMHNDSNHSLANNSQREIR